MSESTVEIRLTTPADWKDVRDVRLTALQDAPYAFGSTYEKTLAFDEERWRNWVVGAAMFLAYVDGVPCGLAGGRRPEEHSTPATAELVAMWVRPTVRGSKVADSLVAAVADWATGRGYGRLHLWVTESNDRARRFYERLGFTTTGERQVLPSNPDLMEIGMARPLP